MVNPKRIISPLVISTALGPGGSGIFPYTLLPAYRRLLRLVKETGTTILSKSSTRFPRQGNFIPLNPLTWGYIRRIPDQGMLNAYGLTNQGVAICADEMNASRRQGFKVIPNFYPEFAKGTEIAIQETLEAVNIFQGRMKDSFEALELNFSCPNSREAIAENVFQSLGCVQKIRQQYPDLLLIAKISVVHPYEFAQELERLGVLAIHGVNTIPYDNIFPPEKFAPSPLAQVGGGGVSGGPAFEQAYSYNKELRKKVNLFLIMGCGVRNKDNIKRYFDLGADAVSFCTLALRNPAAACEIINSFPTTAPSQV